MYAAVISALFLTHSSARISLVTSWASELKAFTMAITLGASVSFCVYYNIRLSHTKHTQRERGRGRGRGRERERERGREKGRVRGREGERKGG